MRRVLIVPLVTVKSWLLVLAVVIFLVCFVLLVPIHVGLKLRDFGELCSNAIRGTILIRLAGELSSNTITVSVARCYVLITLEQRGGH